MRNIPVIVGVGTVQQKGNFDELVLDTYYSKILKIVVDFIINLRNKFNNLNKIFI